MPYTAEKPRTTDSDALATHIKGWGADLDPKDRPAVPKEKTPPNGTGAHWITPEQQVARVKIHKSIEHHHLTPIFGTACPPKGVSGLMRNFAYRYSEGRMIHWLTLLLADRVDMVESILIDAARGRPDNVFAEMGLKAEWKRHGIRSRVGEHRGSRLPKEALLFAGAAVIALSVMKRNQKLRNAA